MGTRAAPQGGQGIRPRRPHGWASAVGGRERLVEVKQTDIHAPGGGARCGCGAGPGSGQAVTPGVSGRREGMGPVGVPASGPGGGGQAPPPALPPSAEENSELSVGWWLADIVLRDEQNVSFLHSVHQLTQRGQTPPCPPERLAFHGVGHEGSGCGGSLGAARCQPGSSLHS